MEGWIKLHRQILENPVVNKDNDHFKLWCYLLLRATHKDKDVIFHGKRHHLRAGEIYTGRKVISRDVGVSESKAQRMLKFLESEQQIEQRTDSQNRIITIKNWERYQVTEQQNEQRVNNDRTTSEHIQEGKECKNEKNNTYVGAETNISETTKKETNTKEINICSVEILDEVNQFVLWLNRSAIFPNEKTINDKVKEKWAARRKTFGAKKIAEAFANLVNEPDKWKIKNNGQRPLSWWLHSDERIEEMFACHLKKGKNSLSIISDSYGNFM